MSESIQSQTVGEQDLEPILLKIGLRILPFMFVLYVIAFLDRINISFAGLQMNKDLAFGDEVFGFGAGIFFIGYFLFGLPSNLMVEKLGARKWITAIMIVWGIISVAMAVVKDPIVFYVMRFLLGVAEAGFFPGMILYLTYWFPKKERAAAVGKFMSAIPAAGVLGGLIAAAVLPVNAFSLAGWQWLFITTGLPAILFGISVYFVLADNPGQAKWLTAEEKAMLMNKLTAEHETFPAGSGGNVMASGSVWMLSLLYFSFTLGMYGFQLWLPQIIQSFENSDMSTTALLSAIPAIFQAVGMVLIARHSDKRRERRWHVAVSAWIAACALLIAGVVQGAVPALCALSLSAFFLWGVVGPFWALTTAQLPRQSAAAGIGLINSVGNLGGFAGPYLVGVVKSHSSSLLLPLSVLAVSLALAGVLALSTRSDTS